MIRLLAIVLAMIVAPLAAQDIAGLGKVSADEPLVVSVRAPGEVIERAMQEARKLLPDVPDAAIESWLEESVPADMGFDPRTPAGWRAIGLDPAGVMAAAFGDPGGWLGLPQRIAARLAVVDAVRFQAYLVEQADGDLEELPNGGLVADEFAGRAMGNAFLLVGHDGRDAAAMARELDGAAHALGEGPTISGAAVYRALRQTEAAGAFAALHLRPTRWRTEVAAGEPPAAPPNAPFESLLVTAGRSGFAAALQLLKDEKQAALLTRGGDPRIALRRMPQPAAVLVLSIADPDALFAWAVAYDEVVAEARGELEPLVRILGPLLRGGAIGVAAYPGEAGVPRWAAFATTTDHDKAVAAVTRLLESVPGEITALDAPDGARLWRSPAEGVVIGVRDGAVFVGDAEAEVIATVRGATDGHEPRIAGDALCELHADLKGLLGEVAASAPAALLAGGVAGRIDRVDDVLVGTLRRVGGPEGTSWLGEVVAWVAWDATPQPEIVAEKDLGAVLSAVHRAATMYAVRNGQVPAVQDLVTVDANGTPYLEKLPVDPWGNVLEIRKLAGRLRFEVASRGPDGLPGTDDDETYPARR